jgi:hypothetical protein
MKTALAQAAAGLAKPKQVKSAKPKMPTIIPESNEIKRAVDDIQMQKAAIDELKTALAINAAKIYPFVQTIQDKDGFNRDYHNSYIVVGNKEELTVQSTNKFSVNQEDLPEIKQLLGDNFNRAFNENLSIKVKDTVLHNETLSERLLKLIGPEGLAEFFDVETTITPKANLTENIYTMITPKKLEKLRLFIRQAKPSLK